MPFLKPSLRRWIIVAIIFAAMVLNYIDRVTISFLKDEIQTMFGLDNFGYALIANVFIFFYAIMYPVSGWLIDRFGHGDGVRRFMFGGILVWSSACIAAVFTRVAWTFGACRAVLGAAEPMAYAAQLRAVTEWFPKKLRATANSLCVAGGTIGMVIAAPLLVGLKETYDWRAAFLVPGVLGIVVAVLWFAFYRNPPADVLAENTGEASAAKGTAFTWPQLWKTRTLWGVILIRFISDPVWYFCLFWLPGYLKSAGLSEQQVGMFGWIPFLFAALGGIGSGIVSDFMVRSGMAPLRARKVLLTVMAIVMPVFAFTPHIASPVVVIAIFSVVCAICLSWLFNVPVILTETFPTRNVSGVLGISAGFGALGSVIFNLFVGRALDTVGPVPIFAVMGGLHLVAVAVLWTMARKENPPSAR
ncbi:ACS family hexuronate transporter-like MFS transporter [Ereboglobus sp. PH5-5]|uniref:MFS transporter n=1 Tax=unclassified Ereboglobus TaxID=2626932 RepID=UPI00240511CB|nr:MULTISPECIES: MFS transporter [unclassified Ereboglobus]MDF9827857.1 ACS family hexuronate transporter-like MFS transporter [Ereboglobus sp. PH5-10]MDF9833524.1 ACS family hexuronate transporter-like MFS transporter [Ereboglobus sp. PH5-5]